MKITNFSLITFAAVISLSAQAVDHRAIEPVDNPDILTPQSPMERNINTLDSATPRKKQLEINPWSDALWKMEEGLIANRYTDPLFYRLDGWQKRRDYIVANPLENVLKESDPKRRAELIDRLSPAEKYDLLVGDPKNSLTNSQWSIGEKFFDDNTLDSWMGICEGSAAAGVMYAEPTKMVSLKTPQGDVVNFHVLDIKGLSSLLWSSYNTHLNVAGSRCSLAKPETGANGAIIDEGCFDTNPGTLHTAVLNIIGKEGRPFFMDRAPGIEVWNVPILGYEVGYYKPTDFFRAHRDKLSDAVIPMSSYRNDPYSTFRSSNAAYIVGVDLSLNISEGYTTARDRSIKSPKSDMSFYYDLELDSQMNIIGGEWRGDSHPDFIWSVGDNFTPYSSGEGSIQGDWDGGVVPAAWLSAIQQSSAAGQPFERIVKKLIELSNQ